MIEYSNFENNLKKNHMFTTYEKSIKKKYNNYNTRS